MAQERTDLAKEFLSQITPARGALEAFEVLADERESLEGVAERSSAQPEEVEAAKSAAQKIASNQDLTPPEQFALEAIIIPDKRPAIDIVDGDYQIMHPLWMHFENDAIKRRLRQVIPSVGRIELPGHPTLPYGGTGFRGRRRPHNDQQARGRDICLGPWETRSFVQAGP